MGAIGGDITEITYNHPTLGSGTIFPKGGEDSTYDLGGFRGADDANMVDGSGAPIRQLNRVRWSFEVSVAWDMNNREELEKLTALAGDPVEAEWTITHINGTVHGGTGAPVGDMQGNGNAATFTLKVSGGGKLKKIVG
jgi:hypothetical protein